MLWYQSPKWQLLARSSRDRLVSCTQDQETHGYMGAIINNSTYGCGGTHTRDSCLAHTPIRPALPPALSRNSACL